jgi:IMP dehydrogenase
VDAYVPLVGPLSEVLEATLFKIRSTMVNVGANSLSHFRESAILTRVSEQSVVEAGTSNVFQFSRNRELDESDWGNIDQHTTG